MPLGAVGKEKTVPETIAQLPIKRRLRNYLNVRALHFDSIVKATKHYV